MTKVTGSCEICKRKFEAPTINILRACLGNHRKFAHGSKLVSGSESQKSLVSYYERTGRQPKTDKAVAAFQAVRGTPGTSRRSEWDRTYRERKRKAKVKNNGTVAYPALLPECPRCHARFHYTFDEE
jgi:hypothetical protein